MTNNPNPALITDEMWGLWTECPIPGAKLSGFYANKPGYHNTVKTNLKTWPNNYSVKNSLDLVSFNRDKARAIDLTLTDNQMIVVTHRMQASAYYSEDTRLDAVKEFYGTLDGKTVFGLSKDLTHGKWERSSADLTHLWHLHVSIFTAYVNSWLMLAPILSVWSGETYEEYLRKKMAGYLPKKNETSEDVKYWQYIHNRVRKTVSPESPEVKQDAIYGDSTATAFQDFWKKSGGTGPYDGSYISAWLAIKYQTAFVKVNAPSPTIPAFDENTLKILVEQWLAANIPSKIAIAGEIEGRITFS